MRGGETAAAPARVARRSFILVTGAKVEIDSDNRFVCAFSLSSESTLIAPPKGAVFAGCGAYREGLCVVGTHCTRAVTTTAAAAAKQHSSRSSLGSNC